MTNLKQKIKRAYDFRKNVFTPLFLLIRNDEPPKFVPPWFMLCAGNINKGTFKLYGISE